MKFIYLLLILLLSQCAAVNIVPLAIEDSNKNKNISLIEKYIEEPYQVDGKWFYPRDYKIIIQDPRTSPSGLALILWIKSIYGDEAFDIWSKLSSKILTVTKGWSESYGMFTSGEAEMVLSFITSQAYHEIAENDKTKTALIMNEGHYVYVELAAKVNKEENEDLSNQFMEFILTNEFQKIIPLSNWSFPVNLPEENWPIGFQNLPKPEKSIFINEDNSAEIRILAIEEWLKAMTK